MKKLLNKKGILGAAALAVTVGFSSPAYSAACLQIVGDFTASSIVCDEGAGDLASGAAGVISSSLNTANWGFNIETGYTKPAIGSATQPQFDINYAFTAKNSSAQNAYVVIWDTDFIGSGAMSGTLRNDGNTQSGFTNLIAGVYLNAANGPISAWTDFLGGALNPFLTFSNVGGGAGFGGSAQVAFNDPNQYAMMLFIEIQTNGQTGITTGDANYRVPEPGTLALLGLGLAGLGFAGRRRQK